MNLAVCGIIENEEGEILMVSRKDNFEDFGLPGGKVKKRENCLKAIVREVREETGMKVYSAKFLMEMQDGDYLVKCFVLKVESLKINKSKIKEKGVVKYGSWEEVQKGSFKEYNILAEEKYNTELYSYVLDCFGEKIKGRTKEYCLKKIFEKRPELKTYPMIGRHINWSLSI